MKRVVVVSWAVIPMAALAPGLRPVREEGVWGDGVVEGEGEGGVSEGGV